MNTRFPWAKLAVCLAALAMVTTPGCLIGARSKTAYRGNYVDERAVDRIAPGDSAARVSAVFGEPSKKTRDGDVEIWRYDYVKETTSRGSLLFLFSTSRETESEGAVFVELRGGVVEKVWRQ